MIPNKLQVLNKCVCNVFSPLYSVGYTQRCWYTLSCVGMAHIELIV